MWVGARPPGVIYAVVISYCFIDLVFVVLMFAESWVQPLWVRLAGTAVNVDAVLHISFKFGVSSACWGLNTKTNSALISPPATSHKPPLSFARIQ